MKLSKFIVTGGFGALGRAVGAVLLESGAQVVLVDQAQEAAGLPHGALAYGGVDLADPHAARRCLELAAERMGGPRWPGQYRRRLCLAIRGRRRYRHLGPDVCR